MRGLNHRWTATAVGTWAGGALLALTAGALTAAAAGSGAHAAHGAAAAPDTAAPDNSSLVMVLDSSGSMADDDGTGRTRMETARSAVGTVVDGLPDHYPTGRGCTAPIALRDARTPGSYGRCNRSTAPQ